MEKKYYFLFVGLLIISFSLFCSEGENEPEIPVYEVQIIKKNNEVIGTKQIDDVRQNFCIDIPSDQGSVPSFLNQTLLSQLAYFCGGVRVSNRNYNDDFHHIAVFRDATKIQTQHALRDERFTIAFKKNEQIKTIEPFIVKHERLTAPVLWVLCGTYILGVWSGNVVRKIIVGAIRELITRSGLKKLMMR